MPGKVGEELSEAISSLISGDSFRIVSCRKCNNGYLTAPCRRCSATGEIDGKECPTCKGTKTYTYRPTKRSKANNARAVTDQVEFVCLQKVKPEKQKSNYK